MRLAVFGGIAFLVGTLALALGVLSLLLPLLSGLVSAVPRSDPGTALAGFTVDSLLGAAFVWVGIGAMRRRRWAPPLMRILASAWLLGGLVALPLAIVMVDGLAEATALGVDGPPGGVLAAMRVLVGGVFALGGVLLPAAFVLVFRDAEIQRTCDRHDPAPAWTDRAPTSVLGLGVGLGALAVLALPMALRPAVPLFGVVVTGPGGAAMLLFGAAVCAYLCRETIRRRRSAFWSASVLFAVTGVSSVVTLVRVAPSEIYRDLGYSDEQVQLLGAALDGSLLAWLTAALTVLTLVYMAGISKHFRR